MECEVRNKVWMTVAPSRRTIRFVHVKNGTTVSISVSNTRRVGRVAYRLALPSSMSRVNNMFHVSMLKKCILDPIQTVPMEDKQLKLDLCYRELSTAILGQDV